MRHGYPESARYTGAATHPLPSHAWDWAHHGHHHPADLHGFCHACCHPRVKCCCHRQCRKESKELLVQPTLKREDVAEDRQFLAVASRAAFFRPMAAAFGGFKVGEAGATPLRAEEEAKLNLETARQVSAASIAVGKGNAFIGGGCCVHLSIEYAPSTPTEKSVVVVLVDDAENTVMGWGKLEEAGVGYQIKESIITTKPGADLNVLVANMTARVRWCEVFSC